MRVTQAYLDLIAQPLAEAARSIRPLVGTATEGHKEYGDEIADFSKVKAVYSDRLLPVAGMFANPFHGPDVYNSLAAIILKAGCQSVLDLGCGGCDFLSQLVAEGLLLSNLYGCSIHIGECEVAHAQGYTNVAPLDMRDIDLYYEPHSFDCVVASWSLQHLYMQDRVMVVRKALALLTSNGIFIGRDYYNDPVTLVPTPEDARLVASEATRYGTITVLKAKE